jgi:hypothetical protein
METSLCILYSPDGSFYTATISVLTELSDDPDDAYGCPKSKMFPSASAVTRKREALNRYSKGRESPHGEIFISTQESYLLM